MINFKKTIFAIACIILCAATISGGEPKFSYKDIAAGMFRQRGIAGLRSMADGEHYTIQNRLKIDRYDYREGKLQETIFDGEATDPKIPFFQYSFSNDENKILLATNYRAVYRRSFIADYWVYDRKTKSLTRLSTEGGEQQATFSPDGSNVAFVRNNDIYMVNMDNFAIQRITTDGMKNRIINGLPDWVYEEEFAFSRAFEFSPDSKKIVWMRFDESQVPEYSMQMFGKELYPYLNTFKYPKPGEKNSIVTLHIHHLQTNKKTKVETGTKECYIPRMGWTPWGELYFFQVNRLQNRFDLIMADVDGKIRIIHTEQSNRYVERVDDETVTFLTEEHRFIIRSERNGYRHFYLYGIKNQQSGKYEYLNDITQGTWDVANMICVTNKKFYYLSGEESPLRRNLYSVDLTGKNKTRLTHQQGYYGISPSNGFRYFISSFSNASTPLNITLNSGDGKQLRVLESNEKLKEVIEKIDLPVKEFFTIPINGNVSVNAYIIKPSDFDPKHRYPVLMTQYSGPDSQQVLDQWSMDWEPVLVQNGYIVVCVDGRGTGMRGEEFRKCTYGDLGNLEVQDQMASARYLQTLPYIDPARIGIYGWSYGGFMALNCILKGNDVFKMAIAVAPVTSWRFYDSIYTEIFNGMPADNPKGYDNNSPINFAHRLGGKLLMIHGSGDDNVHVQNSYRMAQALVAAGKQFDMMIYPDDNHSMVPSGRTNIREKMIEYTLKNL